MGGWCNKQVVILQGVCCASPSAEGYGRSWITPLSPLMLQCTCLDYLLASTEYESFMQLAYDHMSLATWEPEDGELE